MYQELSENIAVVHSLEGNAAIINFSHRDNLTNTIHKISYKGNKNGIPIRMWGAENNLPHYREQIVSDNNIIGTLIKTQRDILIGTGLFAYKEVFVDDKGELNFKEVPIPEESKEFFEKVDIYDYFINAAKEYIFHSNVFTEFTRNAGGGIDSMRLQECKYTRLGEQNKRGIIDKAYISGSWATQEYQKDGVTEYDKEIFTIPMYNNNPDQPQKHFMLHTGDRLLNDGYYNSPTWWGSRPWIELANSIPLFHQANIKNGYTIRLHIQIPKGYFDEPIAQQTEELIKKAKQNSAEKKAAFMRDVNKMLAGLDNTGRTLYTEYDLANAIGKEWSGIKIEPINIDMKDEALLKLFTASNEANISGQGIHPTLANIESQGSLSSGSEMRNAYNVYVAVKTFVPRNILLKPLNTIVKRANGWDKDIFFGFGNQVLTTLDDDPTGVKREERNAKKPLDETKKKAA